MKIYKKILITGGAGFIGTNLIKYLLKNYDSKILCVDNLYSWNLKNVSIHNSNKFEFINHDIRESFDIPTDLTINLACPASPVKYQENKVFTAETSAVLNTSIPFITDLPEFGFIKPNRILIVVDLPAPFAPKSP